MAIFNMSEKYEEFLIDESKFTGYADSISFPKSEKEVIDDILELKKKNIASITIQGGKTGIVGGAVPEGGHILNLSYMNHVKGFEELPDGTATITVESGINMMDLKKAILHCFKGKKFFWPCEPTESSAAVGGIIASNAQGINGMLYGGCINYIQKLNLIRLDGKIDKIDEKNEILDKAVGKEGITGIISEVTLKLINKPEELWGISFFFPCDADASGFTDDIKQTIPCAENAVISAFEYIDRKSIDLIENRKINMAKIKELPDIDKSFQCMIYIEIQGKEEDIEIIAEKLMETAANYNSDPDTAWALSGETEIEKTRAFRHAVPETVNLFIEEKRREDSRITKLATDMSIESINFSELLVYYKNKLKKYELNACMFGHALENHIHVNILPENYDQYLQGIKLIRELAQECKDNDGKIVCEHGIGKLKKSILTGIIPNNCLEQYKKLKSEMDSEMIWNRGNIL